MPSCCILQCGAKKDKNAPLITRHRFPRNEDLHRKWLDAIGIENINPRHKNWLVCSLHFKESNFNQTLDVVRLRDNVIPSISLPLEGLGDTEKFYKLDEVVFAEPFTTLTQEFSSVTGESALIENILVEKRAGKTYKKYHIAVENTINPICPQEGCNKKFKSINLLKNHIRKIHCSEKRFICEWCGVRFSAKYLLERHTVVHKLLKVSCPICKKELSARTKMTDHLNTHTKKRTHTCDVCQKVFTRKFVLDRHKMKMHRDVDVK